ncbi:MAG: serine--tRNA ligase, partial [Bacteroidales bacterium]|nr:serine--tRNA ligase [Bacteroidales bacterium]
MLQLNVIRENKAFVIERLKVKNFQNAEQTVEEIISQDNLRRELQKLSDDNKQKQNFIA